MKRKLAKDIVHRIDGELHVFPKGLTVQIIESVYGRIMEVNGLRFLIKDNEYI